MKSFTDIEQSMKLAKILPHESADMTWVDYGYCKRVLPKDDVDANAYPIIIPAWSLAALFDAMPPIQELCSSTDHYYRIHCMNLFSEWHDNVVDTCYEMIFRLYKKGLL